MIFSRRKPVQAGNVVFALPQAAHGVPPDWGDADAAVALRKRTDTDGTERRARQTKQDNELV